jgi:hypothetical protein
MRFQSQSERRWRGTFQNEGSHVLHPVSCDPHPACVSNSSLAFWPLRDHDSGLGSYNMKWNINNLHIYKYFETDER